jgi:hypothetical protein
VTSWRDTASAQAQADLDGLLSNVMPLAKQTLGKHGELLPYAATVDNDGNEALVSPDPGQAEELPSSHDVLALLYEAASNSSQSLRAVAFVAAVRVSDAYAIRVELEHKEGISMAVVLPYERDAATDSIAVGASRATANPARVWPTDPA